MLPLVGYTSERVLAFELERLFAGSWVCVARAEDLPDPGDRLAVQVGDVGVLVVRDRNATLRAFANLCRHRGHELPADAMAGSGSWPPGRPTEAKAPRVASRSRTPSTTTSPPWTASRSPGSGRSSALATHTQEPANSRSSSKASTRSEV